MKQSLDTFRQNSAGFDRVSSMVRGSWQDSVANAFYEKIVEPLKAESSSLATAMDDLSETLQALKQKIDKI